MQGSGHQQTMMFGEAVGGGVGANPGGANGNGNVSGNGLNGNSGTTDDNSSCNTSITKGGQHLSL
jgi:hypothetical protein